MEGVLVPLIVFAAITAWILGPKWLKMAHEEKLKWIETNGRGDGAQRQLADVERKQLEERLRNLESIVCGVDFELNAKLNRLASRQIAMLPAHPSASPGLNGGFGGGQSDVMSGVIVSSPADAGLASTMAVPKMGNGTRIGDRYVIERPIGSGGMGTVYLARDEKLGEVVALKVVRDAFASEASTLERFRREVSAARRIAHPNVVRLHDLGEEKGLLFLSMEYVAGESFRELMKRQGAMPPELVRAVLGEVCDGLAAAHDAGVVHRDLKPENILIHGDRHAKIIDFGIAKLADLEGMTATRMILGTPQYMSPEQIRGRPVDTRTDLYALGVVVFEALTGKLPFEGSTPISVGFAHCNEPVPTLRSRRGDVPEAWEPFVQKALAKEPSQRFATAVEMRRAIPS